MLFLHVMDMTLMRSFLAVAEAGAITEAADRIGVTQPALTRRLQQLEDYLGAKLLDRGRKGATLTEAGVLVEAEGRALIDRYDALRDQVSRYKRLEGGTIKIGGGATAVSFLLPRAIARFQAAHPNVLIQMREAGSSEIAEDVASGRIELGVVTLPVRGRNLDVRPLITDRITLVSRSDHPLAHKRRVGIGDLADYPFVAFEAGSALRQIIDASLRDAGVETQVAMELRSIPAILRLVSTTGHLAFVSHLGVETQDDVVEIRVLGLKIERRLALITRRDHRLSPAAARFAGLLSAGNR